MRYKHLSNIKIKNFSDFSTNFYSLRHKYLELINKKCIFATEF